MTMTQLPRVTAKQIIPVLEKQGFSLTRQSGSHMIYRDNDGKRTTVSYHAGKILHPKTLKNILRDADITAEVLKELL
jgi:predicted RNA binding protein YcfA (HicA-like mRNA interferase family)